MSEMTGVNDVTGLLYKSREQPVPARCRPGLRNGLAPTRSVIDDKRTVLDQLVTSILERLGASSEQRLADRFSTDLVTRVMDLETSTHADASCALTRLRERLIARGHDHDSAIDALAHACIAAKRTLGLVPREGQRRAAAALLQGRFVEMPTGEGKTLATALAASAIAMDGTPVHVLTANDYLAERDATYLSPLYAAVGLTSACVLPAMDDNARRAAYACDVVHLTGKQAGFDWMRDALSRGPDADSLARRLGALTHPAMRHRPASTLQRGLCACILDEADSLLLDEARTPLVLAAPLATGLAHSQEGSIALALANMLKADSDFQLRRGTREVTLTDAGKATLARLAERVPGVWRATRYRDERVRQALVVLHLFERDRDYVVRDEGVLLVDEQSGRALPDRRLQHGLHGLLELKEHCQSTPESDTVASIAFQSFFLRYVRLVGTSGTLREARGELARVYGARLIRVPPEHPSCLTTLPPCVFLSRAEQLDALVEETRRTLADDRPVLIGTRSVEQSRGVSALLTAHRIRHRVLDASQDVDEAVIVAEAGHAGRVTVATNMAGRGTDIPLGEGVAARGGLHLVSLAFNDARRIDRQLAGRTARQGEAGSFRQLWTLDDQDLEAALPAGVLVLIRKALRQSESTRYARTFALSMIRLAQRRLEWRHARQRRAALVAGKRIARHVTLGGHPEHPA